MRLPATVTLEQASAFAASIEQEIAAGTRGGALELDASTLENFDTSLLAVLLHARRQAHASGGSFSVTDAPDKLAQLASLYGVDGLLGLTVPSPAPPAAQSTAV